MNLKALLIHNNSFYQVKLFYYIDFSKKLENNVSACVIRKVFVKIFKLNDIQDEYTSELYGICTDNFSIHITSYKYNKLFPVNFTNRTIVKEYLYVNLFKSNYPITQQPN